MKKIAVLIIAIIALTGCKSAKQVQNQLPVVPIETNTDTKIIHTESIDTVFVEIPAQSAERTTPERFSHLETDYAQSDAKINTDGTLTHTLKNKPTKHPAPVKNTADTVYVEKAIEKPVPVEVPFPIERELTWWEKMRLKTWAWLATTFVLCAGWISRKPIMAFARRFIKKTK